MNTYNSKLCSIVEDTLIVGMNSTASTNEIGALTFHKIGVGQYNCVSDRLFSLELTRVRIQPSDGTTTPATGMFFAHVIDENTILIYSTNVNTDDCVDADFGHLDFEINNL